MKRDDGMPHRLEHAPHLPLATFAQTDEHVAARALERRARPLAAVSTRVTARGSTAPDHLRRATSLVTSQKLDLRRKRHAVAQPHARAKTRGVLLRQDALHQGDVALHHVLPRMEKRMPELPVGREQKEAPSYPHRGVPREQPGYASTSTSSATVRLPCGSLIVVTNPAGLWSMMVFVDASRGDAFPVDGHDVGIGVHLHPELNYRSPLTRTLRTR